MVLIRLGTRPWFCPGWPKQGRVPGLREHWRGARVWSASPDNFLPFPQDTAGGNWVHQD